VHAIFSANNNPQIHDNYAQYFDKFVWAMDNHLQTYVWPLNHIY
jgi:hypothetical protein